MPEDRDRSKVVAQCRAVLGTPAQWKAPDGYPNGLALCVLDAIWSIGVKYRGVENVLHRYKELRRAEGADPDRDTPTDLIDAIIAAGGPDPFSDLLGNHQRTSTRGGISKSQAVLDAAHVMVTHHQVSPADVKTAQLADLERDWRRVHGQRSGISWRYFLLLTGYQEVKPDRMIVRFVQGSIDRHPSTEEAAQLVVAAADELDVDVRTLDHRIWQYQSGRG